MSNKWRTKRTPEEQQAIADFNRENDQYWYGDYDLGGPAYVPKAAEERERRKRRAMLDEAGKQIGYQLPDAIKNQLVRKPKAYDPYESYKQGGVWRGYQAYKPATLDYRYIEQMANALASKHSVQVKVGDGWAIDLDAKVLTYNPMTLMNGSKAQMIASLLHEIGHLRHTTPVSKLKTNQVYGKAGHEILNLYEDFRVDEIMANSYSGAGSVYEANMPVIESIAESFGEKEKEYRAGLVRYLEGKLANLTANKAENRYIFNLADIEKLNADKLAAEQKNHKAAKKLPATDPVLKRHRTNALARATRHINAIKKDMVKNAEGFTRAFDELNLVGEERTKMGARKRLKDAIKIAQAGETLLGFEALTICEAYGVKAKGRVSSGMRERVDKCIPAIAMAREVDSTQAVIDTLNAHVYPHIRDLLLNFEDGKNLESSIGSKLAKEAAGYARHQAGMNKGGLEARQNQKSRNSNTGDEIPSEWAKGNYDALKQSVQTAINDLVQRLRYIRASDNANKYDTNLKRGKLHGKHLYRLRLGNDRLFRKKTEQVDRVGQVGMTIIIDKSGSMHGESMIHTVRGAIILAETCKELNIPLELMAFSGTNKTLKTHEAPYDREAQGKLAELVRATDGASNLYMSLDKTKIKELKKKNKVAVILSDGGVGGGYEKYFATMRKANVVPVGIGLGCGNEITKLVGAGESTDNAYELPAIFDKIMRGCINKTIK